MELQHTHTLGDLLMIWFFGRSGESLQVEMRYDKQTREFALVICGPAGAQCERFGTLANCRLRLVELEHQLDAERWIRARSDWRVAARAATA